MVEESGSRSGIRNAVHSVPFVREDGPQCPPLISYWPALWAA